MTFNFTTGLVSRYLNGELGILINIPNVSEETLSELSKLMEDEKLKTVEIDYFKEKRSLTANGYMFALIEKIAKKIGANKNDLYVNMIVDYGIKYENMFMTYEAFQTFDKMYSSTATTVKHNSSLCRVIKQYSKGDKEWVEFETYIGSSGYDKKQFSRLLDGVVSEAKLQGIETLDDIKMNELIERYEA